jgi:PAS domain S-box-containing protein
VSRSEPRPARRLAAALPWLAAGIGAVLVGGVAALLAQDLRTDLAASSQRACILASGVAEAVGRRLEAVEFALAGLAERADPARLWDPDHRRALHRALVAARDISRDAYAFIVLDRDGRLVATSRVPPEQTEDVSLADRPLFAPIAAAPAPGLAISAPYLGLLGSARDRPIVSVGRPLFDAAGGFAGVVATILPVDGRRGLLPQLDLPDSVRVRLFRRDGTLLEALPATGALPDASGPLQPPEGAFGADAPAMAAFVARGGGEDATYLAAWQVVDGGRAVVVTGIRRGDVIGRWAGHAAPVLLAALLMAAVLVLLARRLARAIGRLDAALGDLALREGEMRTIADSLGIVLWVRPRRLEGTRYRGAAAERLTGRSIAELESRPFYWREEVTHPEDREELQRSYRGVDLAQGWRHVYRIVARDGRVRWIEDRAVQIKGPDGDGPVYGAITDITELHEARERLSRQEAHLADAARIADLAFWRLRLDSPIIEWSEESYRHYGVDPASFVPTREAVSALVVEEDRARAAAVIDRVIATGEPADYVFRHRRPDGAVRLRWTRASLERDAQGRPVAVRGISQDITDRERMHAALTQQQLLLAEAGRVAGLGFWRLRKGSDTLEWTDEVYRQMGETRESFVPTLAALYERMLPEDHEPTRAVAERVWRTGEPDSVVYRIRRPDGEIRWRWVSLAVERDGSGEIVAIAGASQDITDQRLASERLARQERQIAEAGRVARIGFYRRDLATGAISCTAEFLAQHGLPRDAQPDFATLRRRVHPEDVAVLDEGGRRVIETGATETLTYRIVTEGGEVRWLRATVGVERGADGSSTALSGLFQDVTQEVEAQAERDRQRQFLEAARRAGGLEFWRLPFGADRYTWTEGLYAAYGVDPASFVPTLAAVEALIHPDDRARLAAKDAKVRATGETDTTTFRILRTDGTVRWRRVVTAIERDAAGNPVGLIGVTSDVTEEVAAREERDRQQRFLEAARRVGHVGFYWRALDSDTYTWTEEIYAGYGVDPARFVPTRAAVRAMAHPDDLPAIDAAAARLMECGESGTVTFRIIRADGAVRWRRATAGLERGPDGVPTGLVGVSQDVTEEVEARAQLERQQRFLDAARRVGRIGFFRRPLDGGPYTWTEEIYRDFGVDPATFTPTHATLMAMIHPDDRAQVEASIRRAIEQGESGGLTYRIIRPDGQIRWRRVASGLERRADGTPVAVIGVAQDVTEEIEARERIAEQARQITAMGQVARIGFYRRALDGTRMVATAEKLRQFGLPPDSGPLDVTVFRDRMHPEDRPRVEAAGRRIVETGESETVTFRVCHSDGSVRWLRIVAGLERDAEGRPIAVTGLSQDVTAEIEARERLDRQQRQLAEAGRVAGLGFWRLRLGSDMFELSEAIYDQLGVAPQDFTSSTEAVFGLMPEEDRAAVRAVLDRVAATGEPSSIAYRIRRPDGAIRHRSSTVGLERAPDGTPVALVGVSTDITDRIEQEARLERAQRLNALGELTGGIAHDVNNLLSVIGLNLELLREQAPNAEARELTDAALHAVGQGAKLARGLLAFAQRQSLRPSAVPLAPLFGGLEALLRRALGGRIALRTELAPGTPPALADPALLETSLVNLVLNARDAMPEGGAVTIRAAPAPPDEAASLGLDGQGLVRISVTDQGEGMSPEVLARAFEPFFTTKGAGKGTGLGLAMVYGFARQSGGEIRIDSAPGAGTTVTLWLPTAEMPDETAEAEADDHAALRGVRLMVVEDEAPLRALIERICREAGMEVRAVADADSALALLRYGVQVDLLLTDIRMPGRLDGHGLAAEARALRPGLPVVLMTGFDDSGIGDAALPLVRKPFTRGALLGALAAVLRADAVTGP